jgi:hypothetical protein
VPDLAELTHELAALDERLLDLDRRLQLARELRRCLVDGQAERVEAEEAQIVSEMDRLMTRIRATEAKLIRVREGKPIRFV